MKEYVGIYIKTEKPHEQDVFGNKMKYHFHITTLYKYPFFVFCLYLSYTDVGCYVVVIFHFVAKDILFVWFFAVRVIICYYILFHI